MGDTRKEIRARIYEKFRDKVRGWGSTEKVWRVEIQLRGVARG